MLKVILRCLLVLIIDASLADWAREGVAHSFSCFGITTKTKGISWALTKPGGKEVKFFQCDAFLNIKCDAAFDRILYDANITVNGDLIQTDLLIKNVSLDMHQSLWKCFIDIGDSSFTISTTYDVLVFAVPQEQICDNAIIVKEVNILIQCVAFKSFQAVICEFFVKSNNTGSISVNQPVTYNNVPSSDRNFTNTECNMTISGTYLGPGTHQFRVVVYPNITGNVTVDMKRASNYTDIITINYPKAALATDCQVNDFIKENEKKNCTCYDKNKSFLPTEVNWSTEILLNGTLTFVAHRPLAAEQKFTCFLSNRGNWSDVIEYRPNVAYGPDNVVLNVNITESDICDQNGAVISGTCSVSKSNPEPTVFIRIGNTSIQPAISDASNVYRFNTTIISSGSFVLLCIARNAVYGEITSETTQQIKVNLRKTHVLIFARSKNTTQVIQRESVLYVSEGTLTITCQSADVSIPQTTILICGNAENSTDAEEVTVTINIVKQNDSLLCFCTKLAVPYCQKNAFYFNIKLRQTGELGDNVNGPALILGWIIAGVFGIALMALIAVFMYGRKNRQNKHAQNSSEGEDYSNLQDQQESGRTGGQYLYATPTFSSGNSTQDISTTTHINDTDLDLQELQAHYIEIKEPSAYLNERNSEEIKSSIFVGMNGNNNYENLNKVNSIE